MSLQLIGEVVCVTIADSGVGIPADQMPLIWKPRRHDADSPTVNLAEIKRIVEAHGGQVWAESTPGQDTTFHVILHRLRR